MLMGIYKYGLSVFEMINYYGSSQIKVLNVMQIIEYSSDRAKEVTDLFYDAVYAIDDCVYSKQQKQAWAPMPVDYDHWNTRLAAKKPSLLIINGNVAGFIELESDGHIDCAYVLPQFQRQGVATVLFTHILVLAKKRGLKYLYVEASIDAKAFFETLAFVVEKENKIIRNGIFLINYSMHREI